MAKNRLLSILIIAALFFSVAAFVIAAASQMGYDSVKYTLYVGTNDKDTLKLEIPLEEARDTINGVCGKYTSAFTLVEAAGEWVNSDNEVTSENTYLVIMHDVSDKAVSNIVDELRSALNQESILVEKSRVRSSFMPS